MKISRFRQITFLALSLLVLVAVVAFGSWYAPAFGDAGLRLQHYLSEPLFRLGGLPITFFFLLKAAIFLLALILMSHFTMLLLQKRVLTHMPLGSGQQYAAARVISYLVFVLGLIVGLQSLGLNLSSLVVVGGALGIGVGLGLQAIVSNFVAGLILLLEQPIKLGDRIEVGNT
jgi:small-conductance mechanosensitive channel